MNAESRPRNVTPLQPKVAAATLRASVLLIFRAIADAARGLSRGLSRNITLASRRAARGQRQPVSTSSTVQRGGKFSQYASPGAAKKNSKFLRLDAKNDSARRVFSSAPAPVPRPVQNRNLPGSSRDTLRVEIAATHVPSMTSHFSNRDKTRVSRCTIPGAICPVLPTPPAFPSLQKSLSAP